MARKLPRVVREPVQVYLDGPDRATLDRAAAASGLPRAEVLRRGLRRFAAELLADESPALSFLDAIAKTTGSPVPPELSDAAVRHDEYLADLEIASWGGAPTKAAKKSPRKTPAKAKPATPKRR